MDQLPQVPDTHIVGNQKVWFREPIRKASTPLVRDNVPPKIGISYVEDELEPGKPTEAPVYHPGPRPVLKPRRS